MSINVFRAKCGIKVVNIHTDSELGFLGICSQNGSVFETPEVAGIAHFAEHMAFKGTEKRSWRDINREMASYGILDNAYTSNDHVMYHASFPSEHLPKAIEVMSDMFFNSVIPEEELEKERKVILEEKKMYEDDHSSAFYSGVGANMFGWDVGHDTIGTTESISSIKRDDIVAYLNKTINPDSVIIFFSGKFSNEMLMLELDKCIPDNHPWLKAKAEFPSKDIMLWNEDGISGSEKIKYTFRRKNIEQSQLMGMCNGLYSFDVMTPAMGVLMAALGGGAFSYLFERIREELGLCYTVGSSADSLYYPWHTVIRFYGYTDPKNVDNFISAVDDVIVDVTKNGINPLIFDCAKNSAIFSAMKSTETSSGRCLFMARRAIHGKECSVEEYLNMYRKIKIEHCNELLGHLIKPDSIKWAVMVPEL